MDNPAEEFTDEFPDESSDESLGEDDTDANTYTGICKYRSISIPRLRKIVGKSETWAKILAKIGYAKGGNKVIKPLKKYLNINQIDYSHLMQGRGCFKSELGRTLAARMRKVRSLDEILSENTEYPGALLKRRLIKAGLIEDKCAICDALAFWCNKPLLLQLDHINGNNKDNRVNNLRLLCPNCHSQTDTYAGKNKAYLTKEEIKAQEVATLARQSFCITCNKLISPKCTHCAGCTPSQKPVPTSPTNEELAKLVANNTYVAIAEKLEVSDSAVRKWTKQAGIYIPRKRPNKT